jgi:endogenous inhibitor of DNA gyrase (YacG/DUF329 family)
MPRVMMKCPTTGKPFPTGVNADATSFAMSDFINNSTQCPHCQQMHRWSKKDVFLEQK